MRRHGPAVALLAALGAYFVFGLAWVSLPGPYFDELIFLSSTFPPNPAYTYRGALTVFGEEIPSMLMPYLGALKGLMWRGVFALWPPSIYSVRVPAVVLGALALLFFYLWVRRFYPQGTALAAVALAATDPTFIYTTRFDLTVVLQHLFRWSGLWMGARWLEGEDEHRPRRMGWLAGCGLCFGLGLWDKATFAWFLAALAAALLLLFPREVRRRLRPAAAAVLLVSFLIGALPFVRYNLYSGDTRTTGEARLQKLDRAALAGKLDALHTTLNGRYMYGWTGAGTMEGNVAFTYSDRPQLLLDALSMLGPRRGTLLEWALAASLLVALLAPGSRRLILFPLAVSAFMWLQVFALAGTGGIHHWVLAYPLPHLAVAAAAGRLWSGANRWPRRAVALSVTLLLAAQIGWDARYLRGFRQTGGSWLWSDAIYEVAEYLNQRHPLLLVNMDWGFTFPLLLLTKARVPQQNFYVEVAPGDSAAEGRQVRKLLPLLTRPNTLFLFHSETFEAVPGVREVFEHALRVAEMRPRLERTFYQRTGEPVAMLVAAEPGSAAEAPPAPVEFSFNPTEVSPGGEYTITCRELAGKVIDLKYRFRDSRPAVAVRFCMLDSEGKARVRVPAPFEPGTVEVVAVRVPGVFNWRPAFARITVR